MDFLLHLLQLTAKMLQQLILYVQTNLTMILISVIYKSFVFFSLSLIGSKNNQSSNQKDILKNTQTQHL